MISHGAGASGADVDDVTENVFVALMDNDFRLLRRYDSNHKLATYLGVITRTQTHRWLRSRRPHMGLGEEADRMIPDTREPNLTDQLTRREAREAVQRALEALGERERGVLRMFYFEGRDYQSIASEIGLKVNSVGALLSRARARLQKELKRVSDLSESDYRSL